MNKKHFVEGGEPGTYKTEGEVREEHIIEMATQLLEQRINKGTKLNSPKEVVEFLQIKIGALEHEVFVVLFLDSKHCVLGVEQLFSGTIDGASVYPREVVKRALQMNAAALIFAHNHPSSDTEPSSADQRLTERLIRALELVDIRVLDHFIVSASAKKYVSFAERGLL